MTAWDVCNICLCCWIVEQDISSRGPTVTSTSHSWSSVEFSVQRRSPISHPNVVTGLHLVVRLGPCPVPHLLLHLVLCLVGHLFHHPVLQSAIHLVLLQVLNTPISHRQLICHHNSNPICCSATTTSETTTIHRRELANWKTRLTKRKRSLCLMRQKMLRLIWRKRIPKRRKAAAIARRVILCLTASCDGQQRHVIIM